MRICHILGNCSCINIISEVWIMGDSIPYWAGQRAELQGMPDLNLPGGTRVVWMGVSGMGWADAVHHMQLPALFRMPPKVLVVHLGGNDLVRHNLQVCFKHIQDSIEYLHRAFPASIIVWANILPRFNWRAPETENKQIDKKRKRVNQFGHKMMRVVEGHELKIDIDLKTPGFFRNDGVHLSDVGLAMYLDSVRECLLSLV